MYITTFKILSYKLSTPGKGKLIEEINSYINDVQMTTKNCISADVL